MQKFSVKIIFQKYNLVNSEQNSDEPFLFMVWNCKRTSYKTILLSYKSINE